MAHMRSFNNGSESSCIKRTISSKIKRLSYNPTHRDHVVRSSPCHPRIPDSQRPVHHIQLPLLRLLIPPLPLRPHQRLHHLPRKDTLPLRPNLRDLLIENRSNLIRPLLPPRHQLPRLIIDRTPCNTPPPRNRMAPTARTARLLHRLLLLPVAAAALRELLLHLPVQVVEDGAVLLMRHLVFGQHLDARLARPVQDADSLELGLQRAQALGDFVVEVAFVVWLGVLADEAKVTELGFEAFVHVGDGEFGGVAQVAGGGGEGAFGDGGCGGEGFVVGVIEVWWVDGAVHGDVAVGTVGEAVGFVFVVGWGGAVLEAHAGEEAVHQGAVGDLVGLGDFVIHVFEATTGLVWRQALCLLSTVYGNLTVFFGPDVFVEAFASGWDEEWSDTVALRLD